MSSPILTILVALQVQSTPAAPRAPYVPVAYAPIEQGEATEVTLTLGEQHQSQKMAGQSAYVDRGGLQPREQRGFRIELRTGWDRLTLGALGDDDKSDGLLYGAGLGYDFRVQDAFLGVFIGIDGSTALSTGSFRTTPDSLGQMLETEFSTEPRHTVEAGLRGGWWLTENWNVYGDIAWTELTVDVDLSTTPLSIGGNSSSETTVFSETTENISGFRWGLGTETNLTRDIYAGARFRTTFYPEEEVGGDTEQFEVLTGVGLRF